MAPDSGGIQSHGDAENTSGHLTSVLCEQRAVSVMGGPALPPKRARPI